MGTTPTSSGLAAAPSGEKTLGYPEIEYFQKGEQSSIILKKLPFKVGRKTENDLVIVWRWHGNGDFFKRVVAAIKDGDNTAGQ